MTEKVERLVNLTVALLDARRPMTLAEIRRRLVGYGHDDPESARRMFERDKDDLRRLGVPVETVPMDAFENEWGYRIDHESYAMPPVDLDVEEVTALALALQVAGDDDARRGFAKLAALAPDPRPDGGPPLPATVEVDADALDDVADSLVERRTLRFAYRTAAGEESDRTVDPYGVVQRRGSWYLVGHDHDRDALRVFRVDRFAGHPRAVGEPGAFDVPDDLDVVAATDGPVGETITASVAVTGALRWEVERRGGDVEDERDDGWLHARFEAVDPDRFLPWVLGLGEQAEVTAPETLRAEAAKRLRGLVEQDS